jgi:uncharacterized integral membrane protein (TIGR00697 family)
MINTIQHHKKTILFIVLGGFFIANALIAEFIGVKLFSLESTLGFEPLKLNIFGAERSFNMTAGVLLWPVVFIMTDIINEYFGVKGVKLLSYLAAALITYAFIMVFASMKLAPADFWITKITDEGPVNMPRAFNQVFGQGLWIIFASLVAFLIGQIMDARIFHFIKQKTGGKMLWLRSTGSTLVSQLIDSFVVLFIAFYIGSNWTLDMVIAICIINYIYKFVVAVILTPLLYLVHRVIDGYLGKELAETMMAEAGRDKQI